jgi:hypothetical protein
MVCTACGKLVNTSGGGPAIKLPENINLEGITKILHNIAKIINLSVHRMIIAAAGLLGLLACLMPWYGFSERALGMRASISANAFRWRASFSGWGMSESESSFHLFGFIIFILFAAVIAYCFFEDKIEPLKQFGKFIFAGLGGLIFILVLTRFGSEHYGIISEAGGGIKFGLILVMLLSLAIGALPFIKKLEDL